MIVVYDSNTGIGKRFAESLGYPTQSIKEKLEEPCILITRNAGAGKIPWSTKRFIKKHPGLIKGFVNNGDSVKHGRTFCGATALIIEKYGLQHICDIDQGGSSEDVKTVQAFLAECYVLHLSDSTLDLATDICICFDLQSHTASLSSNDHLFSSNQPILPSI